MQVINFLCCFASCTKSLGVVLEILSPFPLFLESIYPANLFPSSYEHPTFLTQNGCGYENSDGNGSGKVRAEPMSKVISEAT